MLNASLPKSVRLLVISSVAVLIASMLISGVNAYVALASPLASPSVPTTVGFEGQLTDSATGLPIDDDTYRITFSLYSVASGGTAIWSDEMSVVVINGLYSVQLGSQEETGDAALPSNAFDGSTYLGVKVAGDSELMPRIPISAVPYAINARQALGLQGYDVSQAEPLDNEVLRWNDGSSSWEPSAFTFTDMPADGSNASPQDFLKNYRSGALILLKDSTHIEVSAGDVMIDGMMRQNTGAVQVGFTADTINAGAADSRGLDTGSATPDTLYYVYALADEEESTFDIILSANASTPSGGYTSYRRLGWFKTDGSTNIRNGSVGNVPQPQETTFTVTTNTANSTATSGLTTMVDTIILADVVKGGIIDVTFTGSFTNTHPTNTITPLLNVYIGGTQVASGGLISLAPGASATRGFHLTIAFDGTGSTVKTWLEQDASSFWEDTTSVSLSGELTLKFEVTSNYTNIRPFSVVFSR